MLKKEPLTLLAPISQNGQTYSKQSVGSLATNCLSVFDHFVGLALKVLSRTKKKFSHANLSIKRSDALHSKQCANAKQKINRTILTRKNYKNRFNKESSLFLINVYTRLMFIHVL